MPKQPNTTLINHQDNQLVVNQSLANATNELLKELEITGRSRYSVCLEAGITRQTLSRMRKGDMTISLNTIAKVFRVFHKSVHILAVDLWVD